MSNKKKTVCYECDRERERCRAATVDADGNVVWICPTCWRDLDYDRYLYEHRVNEK
jgi:hypothetical protein